MAFGKTVMHDHAMNVQPFERHNAKSSSKTDADDEACHRAIGADSKHDMQRACSIPVFDLFSKLKSRSNMPKLPRNYSISFKGAPRKTNSLLFPPGGNTRVFEGSSAAERMLRRPEGLMSLWSPGKLRAESKFRVLSSSGTSNFNRVHIGNHVACCYLPAAANSSLWNRKGAIAMYKSRNTLI